MKVKPKEAPADSQNRLYHNETIPLNKNKKRCQKDPLKQGAPPSLSRTLTFCSDVKWSDRTQYDVTLDKGKKDLMFLGPCGSNYGIFSSSHHCDEERTRHFFYGLWCSHLPMPSCAVADELVAKELCLKPVPHLFQDSSLLKACPSYVPRLLFAKSLSLVWYKNPS